MTFTLKDPSPEQHQSQVNEIRKMIYQATHPDFEGKMKFEVNNYGHVIIRLPIDIDHSSIQNCLDMNEIYKMQNKLYKTLDAK